jgi:C_GCAxxG_C_C family probable redox protein
MGRLQETCGAVTGAFMVIGLKNGQASEEDTEAKEKTYGLVKEFSSRFKQIHGSLKCKDIIKCDIDTPEGNRFYEDNNLHQKCVSCVEDSVTILNSILK